jgi:pimeloyl-ACP methyl ester carboxylesterase
VRFGRGPELLLAHPALFSKSYYAAAAEVLGARFSCAAFDQRGHGGSSGRDLTLSAMAEDLGAVLDHLGWKTAIVGGTSLGAATSLAFALRHPERVTLLLQDLPAFGPGTARDPARTERLAEALETGDLEEAARRIVEGLSPPRARAWTEALRADWKPHDPRLLGPRLAAWLRASVPWRVVERWPEDLARLEVPTRILALEGDPVHPYAVAQIMSRTIPRARLFGRVASLSAEVIARQWVEVIG